MGIREPLWRAIAVFRFASLGYAALLVVLNRADYSRLGWACVALAAMAIWTVVVSLAYRAPAWRTPPMLAADTIFAVAALLSTTALQYPSAMRAGVQPVTTIWVAAPVLAWAVARGPFAGAASAIVLIGCDLLLRSDRISVVLDGAVLELLAGVVVGYLAVLAGQVERERQRAIEIEAASRERERLARDIHDSVLQVLAMVQRRGTEAGGEAAELGRLAGQQEAALRALVGARPDGELDPREADVRTLLTAHTSERVTVSTPAAPVPLDETTAAQLTSAVRAALDNVRQHGGERARAWVLVEDEADAVTVTVRDDGVGMAPGRLAEAAAAGRLGVSQSICGRLRDLGGEARIASVPGEGTEVCLRLPRARR
jgi:signal transduction histidine kinase